MKYVLCRHCMVLHRQHHGRHQESEAGGNVGARARAQGEQWRSACGACGPNVDQG